jgi:hypothetical protein
VRSLCAVLRTQLFINPFRNPAVNEELQQFHHAFSPFEHFSVIVAQELVVEWGRIVAMISLSVSAEAS